MGKQNGPDGLVADITRTLRVVGYATVLLYLALAVLGVLAFVNARHTDNRLKEAVRQTETARVGLCALRRDLARRVAGSEKFLRENPKGIPGIPAALIAKQIRDTHRTLRALNKTDCH